MKKQITGVAVALLTSAVFTVSASADYYINLAIRKEKKSVQKAVAEKRTYISYLPYWNSLKSLIKHIKANNQNIEIKSLG